MPPRADERVQYGPEKSHIADLRLPSGPGPHPVVAVIHGGYWRARYDLTYTGHLAAALTARGYATWNIEYRRLGNGGGWPETFQDVALAIDALRTIAKHRSLDLERVVALGHSAGGQLALWLAGRAQLSMDCPLYSPNPLALRGIISLAGVTDLRRGSELGLSGGVVDELLGGSPLEVPDRYDAASPYHLLPLGVPQMVLHGTADSSVPYDLAARYVDRAKASGDDARLVTLLDTGHFEPVDPGSAQWKVVLDAVQTLQQRPIRTGKGIAKRRSEF
ncbi:MAG: S9 family peptidase [Chloroflexota bacterium]|nr:S9 family peptidase [Chloroflexota bacterium]